MMTKEPEMLQPDAFCEHTMQQNATAAGTPPRTRWGSIQRSPDPLAGFKGAASRRKGGKGKGWEREREPGREGKGGVDSDVQLEEGRQLVKAGPACLSTQPRATGICRFVCVCVAYSLGNLQYTYHLRTHHTTNASLH